MIKYLLFLPINDHAGCREYTETGNHVDIHICALWGIKALMTVSVLYCSFSNKDGQSADASLCYFADMKLLCRYSGILALCLCKLTTEIRRKSSDSLEKCIGK